MVDQFATHLGVLLVQSVGEEHGRLKEIDQVVTVHRAKVPHRLRVQQGVGVVAPVPKVVRVDGLSHVAQHDLQLFVVWVLKGTVRVQLKGGQQQKYYKFIKFC